MMNEKLQKLLELAKRGVGGEKENAQAMLERLAKKHGIDLATLNEEEKIFHWFRYKGKFEKSLLVQIIGRVEGWEHTTSWHKRGGKTWHGKEMTRAQIVEVEMLFEIYKADWYKKLENLRIAFLMKNDLLWPADDEEAAAPPDEDLKEIIGMAGSVKETQIHKQIEG